MSATDTDRDLHPVLAAIRDQHERIERIRLEETRKLAEMIAATRSHPDPDVNPTAASRAMGLSKSRAHQLVKDLDEGRL